MKFFIHIENLTISQLDKQVRIWSRVSWFTFILAFVFLPIAYYGSTTLPATVQFWVDFTTACMIMGVSFLGFFAYLLTATILDRKVEYMKLMIKVKNLEQKMEAKN
jgi:hypothetical protein